MKRVLVSVAFILALAFAFAALAQDAAKGAEKLAIGVMAPFGIENENAAMVLTNNITQALTLNGLSAADSRFVVVPRVALVKKDVTATAPVKYVVELEISLFLGDLYTGTLMSQSSFNVKGVGNTDSQAYIAAIRNVSSRHTKLKTMIIKGKEEIMAYFNGEGEQILGRIQAHITREDYKSALIEAYSIPRACADLYNKASELIAKIPVEKVVPVTPIIINNYYYTEPARDRVSIFVN